MPIGPRFPQVLSAAGEGADWAWAELYRDLSPALLRYFASQGAAEPEECLGECFVHMVRRLSAFVGDEADFRSWAFTIARSRLVDSWRIAGRRPVRPTGNVSETLDLVQQHPAADRALVQREAVREVLDLLTPDQRSVLLLRVLDQFSVAETAAIIGKSEGAVKVLQHRALKTLRRRLNPGGNRSDAAGRASSGTAS
ncbi:MAG: RNA polymerase sigma factor [Propionicimonas sp.]